LLTSYGRTRNSRRLMRAAISSLLGLVVAGCGSTAAQPAPTKIPKPRATLANPIHAGPIPQTSPIKPIKTGTTPVPPRTSSPGPIPTLKPAPIPTPPPVPASGYTGTIMGTVSDAKTHSPLAGAIISLGNGNHQVRSGAFGQYRLSFPAGPPVAVSVVMNGYIGALAMGRIQPHHSLRLDFNLLPKVAGQAPPPPSLFGTQTLPTPPKG
jgi:hypothetical protein